MTQTFDPGRHNAGEPVFEDLVETDPLAAQLTEGADAAGSASTAYTMSAGDTFAGTIGTNTDTDWIRITFTEGNTYTIDAFGDGNGSTSGFDTDLRIFDASGNQLAYNDGAGAGYDAQLEFTPTSSGTYYIEVSSYNSVNSTGSYTLQVTADEAPPPPPPPPVPGTEGTLEQLSYYLKTGESGFERSYNTSVSNDITVDISGLTADGQQLARWAMEAWEMVADINFVVQNDGVQGNEMITVDDEDSGAFAYFPNAGSTSAGIELNVSKSWISSYGASLDSYSFQTYIHEFGHALGLNHQGNYNYTGSPITYEDYAIFTNDSWQMSIMSYFSQTENTSINASYAFVMGAQMADIAAIQDFYGAPGGSGVTAGNTTFGRGSNLGNYMDQVFDAWEAGTGSTTAFTIYDQDGTDTLDLGYYNASTDLNIDLNGGSFSDLGNRIGVLGIATGTVIENLETGAGDDTVMGNEADNLIQSGNGNDSVTAAAGNDTVEAGAGNDTVWGWGGDDNLSATSGFNELYGGGGNDTVNGGSQADIVGGSEGDDMVYGRGGDDTVWGASGNDTLEGNDGNDLVGGGDGNDQIKGNVGNDTIWGGAGNDGISGDAGNDELWAADGDDTVYGGSGTDELGGGGGRDYLQGDGGNDTLWGTWGDDTLTGGDGDDLLGGGDQNDSLLGGADNDTLRGSWGADTLDGGTGNDEIDVGGGMDTATGGTGADTFVFGDLTGDNVITDFNSAEGDRLRLDDALWGGGMSAAQVVSTYADLFEGDVVFNFLDGTSIVLDGITSTTGLENAIDIF